MERRKTRKIKVGSVEVGGNAPVSIQSMTKTDTKNVEATLKQIRDLEKEGCEIVRVAVSDSACIKPFKKIVNGSSIPVVADIHFDYRLAIKSAEAGADCLRINPGNISSIENIKAVADCAKKNGVSIRVGVNSGSLEKDLLEKYSHPVAEALVESALRNIKILENAGFEDMKISIKSTSVPDTYKAYSLLAKRVDYPFHIGVTESGPLFSGTVKSAVGIGALLLEGIGDTLRVSLSADPVQEVRVAKAILQSAGIRAFGPDIVSCPTCGRAEIDVQKLASEIEEFTCRIKEPITIAVMGCSVNGPGEAKEADIGIAGGKNIGIIFKKGKIIKKVPSEKLLSEFKKIIAGEINALE
ncbi:MAG: flavodoxin-dependent (E)-4-hydroxy-3-methylbut-2-enyl-diphosphate synthase [Candidatus Aureabacteria bacterium]|nr:flavodoxin-dependent (E)-4-hydroxy-3-methylbut-2-enyl-diphosphate synthase [Candidatus Auribacterota bacterium]